MLLRKSRAKSFQSAKKPQVETDIRVRDGTIRRTWFQSKTVFSKFKEGFIFKENTNQNMYAFFQTVPYRK